MSKEMLLLSLFLIPCLGDLKIAALVDTGSDYNAIDADLARIQIEKRNASFIERKDIVQERVSGFVSGRVVAGVGQWNGERVDGRVSGR